ncbi:MAG: hypothetical protein RL383_283, partial [Actinomycetota bacterium]
MHAQAQPDKPAVIDDRPGKPPVVVSFAELEDRANRLANVLASKGVAAPHSKVVWCGQNSVGIVTMVNAARKLGVTAVPLNYRLADDEAAYVTDHCDASVVYVDAEFAALFARIRDRIPKVTDILVFDGPAPDGTLSADDLMAAASPA